MKPEKFVSALSQIDEKYIRAMLEDDGTAAFADETGKAEAQPLSAVQTAAFADSTPKIQHEKTGSRILRYMILIGSAAACLFGISKLMLLNRQPTQNEFVEDTMPVTTALTELPADEQNTETDSSKKHVQTVTVTGTVTAAVEEPEPHTSAVTDSQPAQTAAAGTAAPAQTAANSLTAKTAAAASTTVTTAVTSATTTTTTTRSAPYKTYPYKREPQEYYLPPIGRCGTVVKETYNGNYGENTLYVYLPFGYDENTPYNIVYLLYDEMKEYKADSEYWFDNHNENLDVLLDNMIVNGEIEPMIVVAVRYTDSTPDMCAEMRDAVIPFTESKYSTFAASSSEADLQASRSHRAYGSFFSEAQTAWDQFMQNLDLFAYYMPLSEANSGGTAPITDAVERFGYPIDAYHIFTACGSGHSPFTDMNEMIRVMKDDPHFVMSDSFDDGNLMYMPCESGTDWYNTIRAFFYNGLMQLFRQ